MRYRINVQQSKSLFYPWVSYKPFVIQYKKHWWPFWRNYKEIGFGKIKWTAAYETYDEAVNKLKSLNNDKHE